MSDRGITRENLMFTFPVALGGDRDYTARGMISAEMLEARRAEIDRVRVISNIDGLEEAVLDILARDFKVDWWDPEYSIEEKRRTLKGSWKVHRTLGTKAAVETALGAVFPGAKVSEWFEYGGRPYCFRIELPTLEGGVTAQRQQRVISRVLFYKNLRSHFENIDLRGESTGSLKIGACAKAGVVVEIWPELVRQVETRARVSTGGAAILRQAVEVYPELTRQVELNAQAGIGGIAAARQSVEIYPE